MGSDWNEPQFPRVPILVDNHGLVINSPGTHLYTRMDVSFSSTHRRSLHVDTVFHIHSYDETQYAYANSRPRKVHEARNTHHFLTRSMDWMSEEIRFMSSFARLRVSARCERELEYMPENRRSFSNLPIRKERFRRGLSLQVFVKLCEQ